MTWLMISSWRPRKESKPNTRCSTVAARRAPSGTAAGAGAGAGAGGPGPGAGAAAGAARGTPASLGSLASLGSRGEEDTRQSYGPGPTVGWRSVNRAPARRSKASSPGSRLVEADGDHPRQDQAAAGELQGRRRLMQQDPGEQDPETEPGQRHQR